MDWFTRRVNLICLLRQIAIGIVAFFPWQLDLSSPSPSTGLLPIAISKLQPLVEWIHQNLLLFSSSESDYILSAARGNTQYLHPHCQSAMHIQQPETRMVSSCIFFRRKMHRTEVDLPSSEPRGMVMV